MKLSLSRMCAAASLAAVLAFSVTASAGNNSDEFLLLDMSGKVIGKASYTIDKVKEGYRIRSKFQYKTAPVTSGNANADTSADELARDRGDSGKPVEMDFSATYRVTPEGDAIDGSVQSATAQTTLSFTTSKDRTSVQLGMVHGMSPTNPVTLPMPKPDFLIVPTNDPSAIQVLLLTALAHPHADNTYMLLVPPNTAHAGPKSIYVSLGAPADAAGTLDGKPVALKHYTLKFYEGAAELYTDANGTLMEADMDPINARYVRVKFALTPPAK